MAVGPSADFYAPRFLEYERTGRSFPSWNWASLWIPSAWAFYRKLWVPGFAYALWPLIAVAAFGVIDPYLGDSGGVWLACAWLVVWFVPGVVAALTANSLVYRNAREAVLKAEVATPRPEDAAALLARLAAQGILGGVALSRFDVKDRRRFLVAVTEMNERAEMDRLVAALAGRPA